jgi:hypothetical protein
MLQFCDDDDDGNDDADSSRFRLCSFFDGQEQEYDEYEYAVTAGAPGCGGCC